MRLLLYTISFIILSVVSLAAEVDTAHIDKLNSRAIDIRHVHIDSSKILADSALWLSLSIDYEPGKALAYKTIGVFYWLKGSYHRANEYSYKSLKIYEELDDKNGIVRVSNNIALVFLAQDNYQKAVELFRSTIKMAEQDSNHFMLARAQLNLALTYTYMKKYEEAKEWMYHALLSFRILNSETGIADSYVYLGKVYIDLGEYDSSRYYLNVSYEKYDSLKNDRGLQV